MSDIKRLALVARRTSGLDSMFNLTKPVMA